LIKGSKNQNIHPKKRPGSAEFFCCFRAFCILSASRAKKAAQKATTLIFTSGLFTAPTLNDKKIVHALCLPKVFELHGKLSTKPSFNKAPRGKLRDIYPERKLKAPGRLQPANAAQAVEISIMVFSCDQ
jgi:hypothetical protein